MDDEVKAWHEGPPPNYPYALRKREREQENPWEFEGNSGNETLDKFIEDNKLKWFPYTKFEIGRLLGAGGFAEVYLGTWKDKNMKVALKCLSVSNKRFENLLKEWKYHVDCLDSYEIVNFLGFTKNDKNVYMAVMEYANKGTLKDNLKNITKSSWKQSLYILYRIATGLSLMHERGLIHCDLHLGNVLINIKDENNEDKFVLDGENDVWISDLGLCQSINSSLKEERKFYGVLSFAAPEVLAAEPHTTASDIYSFSMIMYVLISGDPPFKGNVVDGKLAYKIWKENKRPEIFGNIPQCYKELMEKCWDGDPSKRPTSSEVVSHIKRWLSKDEAQDEIMQFVNEEHTRYKNNNTAPVSEHPSSSIISFDDIAKSKSGTSKDNSSDFWGLSKSK